MARNTIAHIDPAAIAHNLNRVRGFAPDSRVMAVVKADAYGHRIDLCLPALEQAQPVPIGLPVTQHIEHDVRAWHEGARSSSCLGNGHDHNHNVSCR